MTQPSPRIANAAEFKPRGTDDAPIYPRRAAARPMFGKRTAPPVRTQSSTAYLPFKEFIAAFRGR